jgi:hypothetical protein
MKELNFKFVRELRTWKLSKLKESFSNDWYFVPKDLQEIDDLPLYIKERFEEIKNYRKNYATVTYTFKDVDEEKDFVDLNGQLQVQGTLLLNKKSTGVTKEKLDKKEAKKKLAAIKRLKFNPLVNDASEFCVKFTELFQDEDNFSSKLELSNFVKLEDEDPSKKVNMILFKIKNHNN